MRFVFAAMIMLSASTAVALPAEAQNETPNRPGKYLSTILSVKTKLLEILQYSLLALLLTLLVFIAILPFLMTL